MGGIQPLCCMVHHMSRRDRTRRNSRCHTSACRVYFNFTERQEFRNAFSDPDGDISSVQSRAAEEG